MYGQKTKSNKQVKESAVQIKDSRIDLRITRSQKVLLESAATAQGQKLSEFVLDASTEAAEIALASQTDIRLQPPAMEIFLAQLQEDPKPISKLQALFARKSVFE